jgi:hypothetical protein
MLSANGARRLCYRVVDHFRRDRARRKGIEQLVDRATLWDVHVDDLIPSRNFRRVHYGEA